MFISLVLRWFLFLELVVVQIFLFLVFQISSRFRIFVSLYVSVSGLSKYVLVSMFLFLGFSKYVLVSMFLFLVCQNLFWSPCFCFWFVKFVLVLMLFNPGVSSCVICSKCPLTPSLGAKYAAFDL